MIVSETSASARYAVHKRSTLTGKWPIGPVSERNFLRSFTASVAVVIPKEPGQGLPIEEVASDRSP